jgi:GWxTD domain-containing protein
MNKLNKIKNIFRFSFLFSALVIVSTANIFSQNSIPDKTNYFVFGDNFFAQAFVMPSQNADELSISFVYSFVFDGLVFQKNNENKYFATPILEATFKDETGIIRKRILTSDTIFAENFEETTSKTQLFSNFNSFSIPISDYKTSIKLTNGKSSRAKILESNIENYDLLKQENVILQPFFLKYFDEVNVLNQTIKLEKEIYSPFLANNFIPFSAKNFTIFIPISTQNYPDFTFQIENIEKENQKSQLNWGKFSVLAGNCEFIENATLIPAKNNFNQVTFNLEKSTSYNFENQKFGLLKIDVKMDNFSPGFYLLKLQNNSTNEKNDFEFEIRWNDIPLSLVNSDYAVEQMYVILTDEEFDNLEDGNQLEKFNNILNYWKTKDPTPETEYNEAMTEFFRRVDFAFFNFQTITQKEGAETDRGKVYILNGKPDKMSHEMNEKISQEVWIYEKLRKKYIFDLISVGYYKLVKIEDM